MYNWSIKTHIYIFKATPPQPAKAQNYEKAAGGIVPLQNKKNKDVELANQKRKGGRPKKDNKIIFKCVYLPIVEYNLIKQLKEKSGMPITFILANYIKNDPRIKEVKNG